MNPTQPDKYFVSFEKKKNGKKTSKLFIKYLQWSQSNEKHLKEKKMLKEYIYIYFWINIKFSLRSGGKEGVFSLFFPPLLFLEYACVIYTCTCTSIYISYLYVDSKKFSLLVFSFLQIINHSLHTYYFLCIIITNINIKI